MAIKLNLATETDVFDALRQIRDDCTQRAEGAADAGDQDRTEDWGWMVGHLTEIIDDMSHLDSAEGNHKPVKTKAGWDASKKRLTEYCQPGDGAQGLAPGAFGTYNAKSEE